MKKLLLILLLTTLSTCLYGCGQTDNAALPALKAPAPKRETAKLRIGFCGMTMENEYHIILANAVARACEEARVRCEVRAGTDHGSVSEQMEIIRGYIRNGVDGIILVPASADGLLKVLKECRTAGIPVINLDTRLSEHTLEAYGENIPFYGTDNYVGGQLTGEFFAEKHPQAGTKVAILRGIETQTNDEQRYRGF